MVEEKFIEKLSIPSEDTPVNGDGEQNVENVSADESTITDEAQPENVVAEETDGEVASLKETLSVIKEVREELASAYRENKDASVTIEKLSSEVTGLKNNNSDLVKQVEQLQKELGTYKKREEEMEKLSYNKRLEKLSSDLRLLGQDKSVEQLSTMSKAVISEFESIASLALSTRNEEKLSVATVPTQSVSAPKKAPSNEKLSEPDFMSGICEVLTSQQGDKGKDGKRVIFM